MRMLRSMFVLTAAVLLGTAATAEAQNPLRLDVRVGGATGIQELATADINSGVGFLARVEYDFAPQFGVYAGYSWYQLFLEETPYARERAYDKGFAFGAIFNGPEWGATTPWLSAGGLYDKLNLTNKGSTSETISDWTVGWELGLGLRIPTAAGIQITPAIRYRSYSPELDLFDIGETDVGYVAFELGVGLDIWGR